MPTYKHRRHLDTERNPRLYELIRVTTEAGKPVADLEPEALREGITVRQLYRIRERVEGLMRQYSKVPPEKVPARRTRETAARCARDHWDRMELDG